MSRTPCGGTGRRCGGILARWDLLLPLPSPPGPSPADHSPGVHTQPESAPGSGEGLEPPQPGRALSTGPLIPLYFLNETRAGPARPGSGVRHSRAALPEPRQVLGQGKAAAEEGGDLPFLRAFPGLVPPADPSSSEPFVTGSKQEQPLNAPIKSGQPSLQRFHWENPWLLLILMLHCCFLLSGHLFVPTIRSSLCSAPWPPNISGTPWCHPGLAAGV